MNHTALPLESCSKEECGSGEDRCDKGNAGLSMLGLSTINHWVCSPLHIAIAIVADASRFDSWEGSELRAGRQYRPLSRAGRG